MDGQKIDLRQADAIDWRWAREREGLVMARLATLGLFLGMLAVEAASLVPAISPSHVEIWRVALGVPIAVTVAVLLPRCFGRPVSTGLIVAASCVTMVVCATLIHIAPPTWAMLLTPIALIIFVAHFLSGRATLIVTGLMSLAVLSLPILSPPGEAHQYNAAQLIVYVPVLWALAAAFHFQARDLRDTVDRAILASSEDSVSGMPNLRTAREEFEIRAGSLGEEGSIGIVLLNVVNLVEMDDIHGQRAADEVVAAIARQLRRVARPEWALARIDVEDFLLIASDLSESNLEELALLCRGTAGSASIELGVPVSVSVGTARVSGCAGSLDSLLDVAQAKVFADRNSSGAQFAPPASSAPVALTAQAPEVRASKTRTRPPRILALTIDLAVFVSLAAVIAATGGALSPATALVFLYVAVQAWYWRDRMIAWRVAAPVLLFASPLLYDSPIHRIHPEAQASSQFNSTVIVLAATIGAISVYRSRSQAQTVARLSASRDPETRLLNRGAFERVVANAESSGPPCSAVGIELRGVDQFTRSAGRTERTRMMAAVGECLTDLAISEEQVGRLGTAKFAILIPGDARFAEVRARQIAGHVRRVAEGFAPARGKSPRVETSVVEVNPGNVVRPFEPGGVVITRWAANAT